MSTHKAFHLKRESIYGEKRAMPCASMKILSKLHKFKLWTRDIHFK